MTPVHLVIHKTSSGILQIGFNRFEKKNAITHAMYNAMRKALESAGHDPDIRVVLLHGSDEIFSAGNDLGDLNNREPGVPSPGARFLKTLCSFEKPVVAAVSGLAVGVGATLLLHCDLVYAATDACFRMPFVDLGLCPEAGSTLLLPAFAGYKRAANALMFGATFGASTAISLGLVTEAVPKERLMAHALDQAQKLAEKPANALLQTKRLMKSGLGQTLHDHMELEFKEFERLLHSKESRKLRDKKLNK